jgi:hypothetical protein
MKEQLCPIIWLPPILSPVNPQSKGTRLSVCRVEWVWHIPNLEVWLDYIIESYAAISSIYHQTAIFLQPLSQRAFIRSRT